MQKIAILGGGIGALATAAELTNDPNWQKNYDITIYQMGWRLGGKGANGRNRDISNRIPEALLMQVEGKVWEWVVSSADLNEIRQRHQISSTNRRSDGVHVRVLGDEPPPGVQPVIPNLEDAYLFCLSRYRGGAAA
jgi:glycine/D-amino acid oxidase-like deaminating enzyme